LYNAAYNASVPGIARQLASNHGFEKVEAKAIATDLLNPNVRCAICGIPGWLVQLNRRRGGPFFIGSANQNARMHPDRIDTTQPHTVDNTRILCPTCNMRRGAEKFSDEEVLRWVRYRWLAMFSRKMLWWLNTTPGEGGRLYRSPACSKRDARFAESNLVEAAFNGPSPTPESESL